MPSPLAQLTDSYLEPEASALPVEPLYPDVVIGGNGVPTRITVRPAEAEQGVGSSKLQQIMDKLIGANGQERYQLWPEKVIRGGLTAAGDVLSGQVPQWSIDKDTGDVHTSPQMIEKAQEISALAGTGGLAGADATLGSAPFLRPALKYKDKLYKGKPGQQHQDVIPPELYPEFERMAMSGEDLSHYNFGFMNHKGQFLDREKALEYAITEGLVDAHAGQYGALTSTLMSDSSKPGMAIEAMSKTKLPQQINDLIAKYKDKGVNLDIPNFDLDIPKMSIPLSWIERNVKSTNKGDGYKALKELTEIANTNNREISLVSVSPKLDKYYEKLGFKKTGNKTEDGNEMVRSPIIEPIDLLDNKK